MHKFIKNRIETWKIFLICTGIVAILCLLILGIRTNSVLSHYDLYRTTGGEGQSVYAIWKIQNGYPLYEWPNRNYYCEHVYNYLFYHSYARILSIFGIKNASILLYGKLLTLIFAFIGAISHWYLMRYLVRKYYNLSVGLFLAMIAFIVWFGTHLATWWALTVRSDMSAMVFAILALLSYVRGSEKNSFYQIFLASILFFLAWSFKQSCVGILTGASLYALTYKRNWKQALVLIVPCTILMIVCLILGGKKYWYNIIVSHLISAYSIPHAIHIMLRAIIPSLFIWVFWIYISFILFIPNSSKSVILRSRMKSGYILIIYTTLTAFLYNFFTSISIGAFPNHFFESFVSAATLSSISLVVLLNLDSATIRIRGLVLATLLMFSMILFPAAQLIFFNKIGRLTLASKKEYNEKKFIAEYIKTLPKPLFIGFHPFNLPWHATDNKYPTFIQSPEVYSRFIILKRLYGGGILGLIARKHFRSLIIDRKSWEYYRAAIKAGYKHKDLPDEFDSVIPAEFKSYLFVLE